MSPRLRSLLALAVMVAAIAVPLVALHASSSVASSDATDAVAPARVARPAPSFLELRDWRTTVTVAATGTPALLHVSVCFLLLAGIVGRSLRRIGDIGDDWRSLLEGAPPALP